jgi:hypothetical protein
MGFQSFVFHSDSLKIPKEEKPRSVGADLPEPVYVYGVNMPPEKKDEEVNNHYYEFSNWNLGRG